jgi:hypothetical protein
MQKSKWSREYPSSNKRGADLHNGVSWAHMIFKVLFLPPQNMFRMKE